ncbi:hypothetical protein H8356DRAFT_1427329 [Neocallimastix lanati (nom. inval.)]|nr:hypothetical protein H8356DRAFT_1427329 [Neocallimastix sp. JGI-2020a]
MVYLNDQRHIVTSQQRKQVSKAFPKRYRIYGNYFLKKKVISAYQMSNNPKGYTNLMLPTSLIINCFPYGLPQRSTPHSDESAKETISPNCLNMDINQYKNCSRINLKRLLNIVISAYQMSNNPKGYTNLMLPTSLIIGKLVYLYIKNIQLKSKNNHPIKIIYIFKNSKFNQIIVEEKHCISCFTTLILEKFYSHSYTEYDIIVAKNTINTTTTTTTTTNNNYRRKSEINDNILINKFL